MITGIIIENEPSAANYLKQQLQLHCKDVSVAGCYTGIACAVDAIRNIQPRIVFLDIELDAELGTDLFRHFPEPSFEVIFTTAYNDYALKAIKLSCLEYLLKPISAEDLVAAINKFRKKEYKAMVQAGNLKTFFHNMSNASMPRISIPTEEGYIFLNKDDIVLCEASGNYTSIYSVNDGRILCSKNVGFIEDMLNDNRFFRCHKSFLVNLTHVRQYRKADSELCLSGDLKATVAARRKEELIKTLVLS